MNGTATGTIAGVTRNPGRWDHVDLNVKIDPNAPPAIEAPLRAERGPPSGLKPSGGGTYEYDDTTFRADIQADGTVEFEDKVIPVPRLGMNADGMPSVEIPLDLTDTLMRIAGEDPYGYEKRKFLRETEGLRAEMAEAACKQNLDASLLDIRPRMLSIWENRRMSLAEKKRRLFGLWDECAEEGTPDILRTAEQIRASILGFIAENLPPGSELAYTDLDLAHFNEKRNSTAEFQPYGRKRDNGLD